MFNSQHNEFMHKQTERLYEAAKALKKVTGLTDVSALLDISPQTLKNWESRGISAAGLVDAATTLGCSVQWLRDGVGAMLIGYRTEESPKAYASENIPFTNKMYSVKNLRRAPVVAWARLGTDLLKEVDSFDLETTETYPFITTKDVGPRCKFVRFSSDNHAPRLQPGDLILVDPDNTKPGMDELALFELPSGEHILLRYRSTVDGFEGYDERGRVLDSGRHGLRVAGVFVLFLRENA